LSFFIIYFPFLPIHVAGGHNSDPAVTARKNKKQWATAMGDSKGEKTRFVYRMFFIGQDENGMVEKHFLAFPPCDPVFSPVFMPVCVVPIKSNKIGVGDHPRALILYMYNIYKNYSEIKVSINIHGKSQIVEVVINGIERIDFLEGQPSATQFRRLLFLRADRGNFERSAIP
jgi:hypothetical protein